MKSIHIRTSSFAKGRSRTSSSDGSLASSRLPAFLRPSRPLLLRTLLLALLGALVLSYRRDGSGAADPARVAQQARARKQPFAVEKVPLEARGEEEQVPVRAQATLRNSGGLLREAAPPPQPPRDIWSETAEQEDMQILSPLYSVRVLRSILQHSDTSWQDIKGECRGFFIQSLLWLNIVDGMRPKNVKQYLQAECRYRDPLQRANDAASWLTTTAVIHEYGTHPGDRTVGHSFPFYVECELPKTLQDEADAKAVREIKIDLVFAGGQVEVETIGSQHLNVTIIAHKKDLHVDVTPPMPVRSEFAVCLSPMWFDSGELPLWRLLEWRQHMANIGIERVNWYGRDRKFRDFVEGYRNLQGSKDLFLHAPNLIAHPKVAGLGSWEQYADQDAVYMSCILNNIQSSDYILVLDADEFLMPDFHSENPLDQVRVWFRAQPKHIGTFEFDRVEMVRPFELGEPAPNDLQQATFSCASHGGAIRDVKRWGPEVKTMYRANTVHAVNQHRNRRMYPMPLELSQAAGKRKNERYQWKLQHSNTEGVWPKLFHFRWYGWAKGDICEADSPVANSPAYAKYVEKLRKSVSSMVEQLSHIRLDRSPQLEEAVQQ